ncbi:type II secretion system F family protein [Streptomyces sp. TRM 70361]|uniref:type II secretion system F family protein n=1 Tax=Streptomyces sp. TRM 70361 TaxID=3116553 RepID=UPI003FCCEE8E
MAYVGSVCAVMVCAGALTWLLNGPGEGARRARSLCAGDTGPVPPWWAVPGPVARIAARPARLPGGRAGAFRGGRAGLAGWCLAGGAVAALLGDSVLPLLAGALAVPLLGRGLRRRERRRAGEAREAAVVELCSALVGELRAGRTPERALLAVGMPGFGDGGAAALAAARFGGDVPEALRQAARQEGAGGLAGVAACWQVAVDEGAGLADGLDRVAGALRAERDQREELRAQLAGPRATALVLALLPVFGLLLGTAMGARPLHVLLHSPAGWACLAGAGALEWAGLAWVARIIRTAEKGGRK